MFKQLILVLLISILSVSVASSTQIYKWVDEEGRVHFSDKKPKNQWFSKVQFESKIISYQRVSFDTSKIDASKFAPNNKVVMFSASWCGYCKKAEAYFKKNNIRYTNYDIEKSPKGKRLYKQLRASGVPVIIVGTKRMNGFSESGFERLYR